LKHGLKISVVYTLYMDPLDNSSRYEITKKVAFSTMVILAQMSQEFNQIPNS